MSPQDRNGWIDLLRGLAAMAVALFHFNAIPLSVPASAGPWQEVWLHGHWGVGVFFALSGYCLYAGWSSATNAGLFLSRRLQRIFPSYWYSLLLVVALTLGVKLLTGVNDVTPLPDRTASVLATLLLATNPLTPIATINWVYWTLTVLLGFYVLMTLVLLVPPQLRLRLLVGLHGLLCAADASLNPLPTGPALIVSYWPVFGAGLALAVFGAHRGTGLTMLILSALHAFWAAHRGSAPADYVLVAIATIIAIAVLTPRSFPRWLAPAAAVGPFSYSLYLIHVPVGIYLAQRFLPDRFTSTAGLVLTQLVQLALCLAAARLFYLLAERPFLPRPRSGANLQPA